MPPADKKSLGTSVCQRALGTEASLSLSLVLLLAVLLSVCLSFLSRLTYLSPPTACQSLYPLTLILPPPLSVALVTLSTPSALQQMNPAT